MAAYVQPGFVVAIINDGKTIRESNVNNERVARIPFGSEYKIRIQNKTNHRAYAKVLIDGTEVHSGKFILRAGEKMDLERFMLDGNNNSGKRLRFVEAGSSEVQDPTARENGEIEVVFEGEDYFSQWVNLFSSSGSCVTNSPAGGSPSFTTTTASVPAGSVLYGVATNSTNGLLASNATSGSFFTSLKGPAPEIKVDAGATVEGSHSSQQFQTSYETFRTFAPTSIKIRLKGAVAKSIEDYVSAVCQEPTVSESGAKWKLEMVGDHGALVSSPSRTFLMAESIELTSTHAIIRVPLKDALISRL